MKKIISTCLCLLLVAALAVTAFAANETTFSMSPTSSTLKRGDTVTLTVSVSSSELATHYGLKLEYDTSVFELVDGNCVTSALINSFNNGFAFMFQNATAYSGSVGTVTLKVKDDAEFGTYTVTGKASVKNGTAVVEALDCSASFTVACNHVWDNGTVTAPTCEKAGATTYKCTISGCGETKTETIAALGHKLDAGKVTTAATCTNNGVKTFTCTNGCGETKTETIAALGHKLDAGKVTTAATCTNNGVKTFTCTNGCGETKTETIAATGHKLDAGKVTTEATCGKDGVKTYTCQVCKEAVKTEVVKATGKHDYTDSYKDNGDGNHTAYCACKDGKIEKHEFSIQGVITVNPTNSQAGKQEMHCVCGAKTIKTLPQLPADLDDVPKTGDITPQITMTVVSMLAMVAAAAYVTKRKIAK